MNAMFKDDDEKWFDVADEWIEYHMKIEAIRAEELWLKEIEKKEFERKEETPL